MPPISKIIYYQNGKAYLFFSVINGALWLTIGVAAVVLVGGAIAVLKIKRKKS